MKRSNLSIRTQNWRFTRLTNAFSMKFQSHVHALALYIAFDTFARILKTLKVTPTMAASITDKRDRPVKPLWRTDMPVSYAADAA